MMSNVQLVITVENDEQADKVLGVLNEGEENGELDFAFDVKKETKTSSISLFNNQLNGLYARLNKLDNRIQPTFKIGEGGEPMI